MPGFPVSVCTGKTYIEWSVVSNMRRFLRSKFFISLVLIILAFILTFVMLPKMYGSQSETTEVVQFIADVNKGTVITEAMLRTNVIGKYGTASGMISDRKEIVGKYAARDITAKEYLFSEMFTDTFEEVEGAADTLIKPGDKLMTFSLSSGAQSVGGLIRPGSIVDIFSQHLKELDEPEEEEEEEIQYDEWGNPISNNDQYGYGYGYASDEDKFVHMERTLLLSRVTVYKVLNSSLEDITALQRKWQAAIDSGEDDDISGNSLTPAYITVIVTPEQALKLVHEEYNDGAIHLMLWPPVLDGDEESFKSDRFYTELIEEDKAKEAEAAANGMPAPVETPAPQQPVEPPVENPGEGGQPVEGAPQE